MTTNEAFKTLLQSRNLSEIEKQALKTVRKAYARQMHVRSSDQGAFIKLYAHVFGRFCNHYNAHPAGSKTPQVELHKVLNRQFESIVAEVTDDVNTILVAESIEKAGRPPLSKWDPKDFGQNVKMQALEAAAHFNEL